MAASDSPELRTIKKCTTQLETALKGLDMELVHFLNQKGDDVADKILSLWPWTEAEKAGELVKCIRRRVKQDPPSYHDLLHWFKKNGKFYEPIVCILEAEFATQHREDLSYFPHESNTLPGGPQLPNNSPSHATIHGSNAHLPDTSPRDMMTPGSSAGMRNTSPNDVVSPGRNPGANLPTTSPTSGYSAQPVSRYSPVPGTSLAIPHATNTLPGQCKPTYEEYCIPEQNCWKLDKKVDFEHEGIDLHLGELAEVFEQWDDIAPLLGLSAIEIDDIMRDFHTQADRRRAALKKWKRRYGFRATYGTLLRACLSKDSLKCADKIVTLLGATGGPTLDSQQPAHISLLSHQAPPHGHHFGIIYAGDVAGYETTPLVGSHPPTTHGHHPGSTYINGSHQQTRDTVGYQTQTVVGDGPRTVEDESGRDGSQHLGGGNGLFDTKPSMDNPILLDVIKKVSSRWHVLGLHFGQTPADLDNYERRANIDNHRCCVQVFSHWINNGGHSPRYPLSWKGVYDVLVAIGHRGTADNMKAQLAG